MIIREIKAKTILSKSKIMDYTINPYVGCEHACSYCYARFIKRFTKHKEPWGDFVDVKINAPELLRKELEKKGRKKQRGIIWISGLCDCYQPIEKDYEITRRCLKEIAAAKWPCAIQTKSPLVLRDIDLLKNMDAEVCLTITTDNEDVKMIFEAKTPTIDERIEALEKLHKEGIKTRAMLAPLLPFDAKELVKKLKGKVDSIIVDKMNYHYADWLYKKHKLEYALQDKWLGEKKKELIDIFKKERICFEFLF
ncbi:radical SAM protein [Candidatus Pacearchaeota archaeon]|nr:radical SAM protein [Candidatus Pacearchaeota archaeon]